MISDRVWNCAAASDVCRPVQVRARISLSRPVELGSRGPSGGTSGSVSSRGYLPEPWMPSIRTARPDNFLHIGFYLRVTLILQVPHHPTVMQEGGVHSATALAVRDGSVMNARWVETFKSQLTNYGAWIMMIRSGSQFHQSTCWDTVARLALPRVQLHRALSINQYRCIMINQKGQQLTCYYIMWINNDLSIYYSINYM